MTLFTLGRILYLQPEEVYGEKLYKKSNESGSWYPDVLEKVGCKNSLGNLMPHVQKEGNEDMEVERNNVSQRQD